MKVVLTTTKKQQHRLFHDLMIYSAKSQESWNFVVEIPRKGQGSPGRRSRHGGGRGGGGGKRLESEGGRGGT